MAMLLIWLWYAIFGHPRFWHHHGDHGDHGDRGGDRCFDHLVPWKGPLRFESQENSTSNLAVLIEAVSRDRAKIQSRVQILISDEVQRPTVVLTAEVSKKHLFGGDDGDEEEAEDGLHIHINEHDRKMIFEVTADDYGHGDHDHHRHRFCAKVLLKVLFPSSMTHYGRLEVTGTVMDITSVDLASIDFRQIAYETTVGKITASDGLMTRHLTAKTTTGHITIPRVQAPEGSSLHFGLYTTVGDIMVKAILPEVDPKEKDPQQDAAHDLLLDSSTGTLSLEVEPASKSSKTKNGLVPGDLKILAQTKVGSMDFNIALANDQALKLEAESKTGTIGTTVSDNFLGDIRLQTEYGRLEVLEKSDGASTIEYEKDTKKQKFGKKVLKSGSSTAAAQGLIDIRSDLGKNTLKFK
ncbi:hypothetical protein BGZ83_006674 [Gryganskiella cystojenkinii]|nr:hypothetical protein BGZ83_006674 [Gryganskiella cystojenkinii]